MSTTPSHTQTFFKLHEMNLLSENERAKNIVKIVAFTSVNIGVHNFTAGRKASYKCTNGRH